MKILVRSVAILLFIGSALTLGIAQGWLPQTPSALLKLLPKPKFEKNNLEGSGDNGRVIDLQGCWLNEGKLTELVIRSKEAEKGWELECGNGIWVCGFHSHASLLPSTY